LKKLCILSLCLLFNIGYAQKYCKYRPKSFEKYEIDISTEYAGLFQNAINLHKRQIQVESAGYFGALMNTYNKNIFATFVQLRFAIRFLSEFQFGGYYQKPYNINTDSIYYQQWYMGIKKKIFFHESRLTKYYLSSSIKYVSQRSWMEGNHIRSGFQLALNSSMKYNKVFQLDISYGTMFFQTDKIFSHSLSGRILFKNDLSKVGIFGGFCVNHYTKSFLSLGLNFTDNKNYIFLIALGFLEKAITPNISYSQVFRK
jgi:hypothetical protein